MCAAVLPFDAIDQRRAATARALAGVRQVGGTQTVLVRRGAGTVAREVGEAGGFRVRLPKGEHGVEVALINSGGGLAGGDRAHHRISAEEGAAALVTTPAAERVYRTLGPRTEVVVQLRVGRHARLVWLPQETILYDGAALDRRLEAEVEPGGSLVVLELTVLGRIAMGETLGCGHFSDAWRIRRAGRLAFAESVRLDGDVGRLMQRAAVGNGANVLATLLLLSPDAPDRLEPVRQVLAATGADAAASSWNDLLVVRMLGSSLSAARATLAAAVPLLAARPMPRLWST